MCVIIGKKTVIITNEMVKKYVSIDDVIESVENIWKWYGEKQVVMPPKITTDMSSLGVKGWFNSMPSYIGPLDSAGKKPGRTDDNERLMCELVGMGSPDLCIATLAYNRVKESGEVLTEVDMLG